MQVCVRDETASGQSLWELSLEFLSELLFPLFLLYGSWRRIGPGSTHRCGDRLGTVVNTSRMDGTAPSTECGPGPVGGQIRFHGRRSRTGYWPD